MHAILSFVDVHQTKANQIKWKEIEWIRSENSNVLHSHCIDRAATFYSKDNVDWIWLLRMIFAIETVHCPSNNVLHAWLAMNASISMDSLANLIKRSDKLCTRTQIHAHIHSSTWCAFLYFCVSKETRRSIVRIGYIKLAHRIIDWTHTLSWLTGERCAFYTVLVLIKCGKTTATVTLLHTNIHVHTYTCSGIRWRKRKNDIFIYERTKWTIVVLL